MRTTLQIDDDVLDAVRDCATAERKTIGAVISDLARQALRPTPIRPGGSFPVFDVPSDARRITPEDVARARDDE